VSIFSQRFLIIKGAEQTGEAPAQTELIIVLNWFERKAKLLASLHHPNIADPANPAH